MHLRRLIAFLAMLLPAIAGAQSLPVPPFYSGFVPTVAQWNSYFAGKMDVNGGVAQNFQDGTLSRAYAGRPLNGAASNGTALSNSGNINWFGAATIQSCGSNPFGNPGTWLGCEQTGTWQAADTYSLMELIAQPGAGIAVAAACRSSDNTASQCYTIYDYAESDGTLNGTVAGRSSENAYFFAWNRNDIGTSNGTHYAVGLEIDCENEAPFTPQTPYALNNNSFCGNLLLAAGGDFTNGTGRVSTFTSYAIGMATQNAGTSKFDAGLIAATNAFNYTHGPAADMADVVLLGDHQAITWVDSAGSYVGVISSLATAATAPMQMLFTVNGVAFTDNAENQNILLASNGRITATELTLGNDTQSGVFPIIDSAPGGTRLLSYQDASATVVQNGLRDVPAGNNTGSNWYLQLYSDPGVNNSPLPTVNAPGSGFVGTSGTMTWSGSGCVTNPVLAVTAAGGAITSVTAVNTAGQCQVLPADSATTWTPGGGLSVGTGASFNVSPVTTFLFNGIEVVRAVGVALFPQGLVAGGPIARNSQYGFVWIPTTIGTPTGTPNPPVAGAGLEWNTSTHVLNIYDPVAAGWYSVAGTPGAG